MAGTFDAFLPANVRKHPGEFLGPAVLGTIIQGLEAGILMNMAFRYWSRARGDHIAIKTTVFMVIIATMAQTSLSFYDAWNLGVTHFGDFLQAVNLNWSVRLQPLMNTILGAPVQGYLIWRCWNAMKRRWSVLMPLCAILAGSVVATIITTVKIIHYTPVYIILHPTGHLPYSFITSFVLSAALDIMLTSIMLWFLLDVKTHARSRRSEEIIAHLMRTMWEAAVPPCLCAIVACLVYTTMSLKNLWDIFFQCILGKLYVISFFVILNGREDLKRSPTSVASESIMVPMNARSGLGRHRSTCTTTEVRVHMSTVVKHDSSGEIIELPNSGTSWTADDHDQKASLDYSEPPPLPEKPAVWKKPVPIMMAEKEPEGDEKV
ncbi:hypothetical protein BD410DRAFT_793337 [Rickenella mellea]|uniref:DUF6534 domain-containing protein n=1 Tax=Rickenella mellea TaxID=50990 RepID=A0A4Y7PSS2_9AGAM|nr:hypothetical protein BD410DRAFT_793337 [Rickenella mellea]